MEEKNRKELTKDDVLPLKSLYKSILEEQPDNSLVAERLGYLYSDLGEERNAIQAWSKSKTKNGYYECGKIYQYGRDTISQNLERAADYLKRHMIEVIRRQDINIIRYRIGWKRMLSVIMMKVTKAIQK